MTIKEYFDTLQSSAPYVLGALLALGTVYGKYLNLQGTKQFYACFGTGCLIGVLYYLALLGIPGDVKAWAFALLTVLIMGLLPSGVYEMIKAADKSAAKSIIRDTRYHD